MALLRLRLFGNFQLQSDRHILSSGVTRKGKALIAYLALAKGKYILRDVLATLFWPELSGTRAHKSLSTEIWRLRKAVGGLGLEVDRYLVSSAGGIKLDSDLVEVDALRFLDLMDAIMAKDALAETKRLSKIQSVVDLYKGAFLESNYDDWSIQKREYFSGRHQTALAHLLREMTTRRVYAQALLVGEDMLTFDPLQENVHRAMMRCHAGLGNRAGALQQYEKCATELRDQLSVAPMPETEALYQELATPASERPLGPRPFSGDGITRWHDTVRTFNKAQTALNKLGMTLKYEQEQNALTFKSK